jgi:hypothetical protein
VVFVASFHLPGRRCAPWQRHCFSYILGILFAYFSAFCCAAGNAGDETWRIRLVQGWRPLTFNRPLRFSRFRPAAGGRGFAGVVDATAVLHDRIAGTWLARRAGEP